MPCNKNRQFIPNLWWRASGVYLITNNINGKVYVGSAVCIKKRLSEHMSRLKSGTHHNPILQRSWKKHGENSFVASVLEFVYDTTSLASAEQEWINIFNSCQRNVGYNVLQVAYSSVRPPKPCVNCKRPSKPLRKGRCRTCNNYRCRNGIERPYVNDGRLEKAIRHKEKINGKNCMCCFKPLNRGIAFIIKKQICFSCERRSTNRIKKERKMRNRVVEESISKTISISFNGDKYYFWIKDSKGKKLFTGTLCSDKNECIKMAKVAERRLHKNNLKLDL